jgi:hypothetical protein
MDFFGYEIDTHQPVGSQAEVDLVVLTWRPLHCNSPTCSQAASKVSMQVGARPLGCRNARASEPTCPGEQPLGIHPGRLQPKGCAPRVAACRAASFA